MSASSAPVGKVCCVFTDIVDSTNMWAHNQRAMQASLLIHDIIIRAELVCFNGYEVKTLGDGFLVSFSTPKSALHFCLSAQRKLQSVEWPKEILDFGLQSAYWDGFYDYKPRGLRVRMGIHFGVPFTCKPNQLTGRMDYYGYMVNMAARIHGEAQGDEIALSDEFIAELYEQQTGMAISTSCLNHFLRAEITGLEFNNEQFRVQSKGLRHLKGVLEVQHVFLIILRPQRQAKN